jgi:geranyl-CoA carboxylase alpha subunit
MGAAALQAARAVNYLGAGTVEFLLEASGRFFFLEMNTRLQVEHPVTEMITGQDLVAWQLHVAAGEALPLRQEQIQLHGHAMEVRLYAEDPAQDFLPQTGQILRWQPALLDGVRIDHGLLEGHGLEKQVISPFYDPMLGKIIAHGATREEARRKLLRAVEDCVLLGVNSNQRLLAQLLKHPQFVAGHVSTGFIAEHFSDDPALRAHSPSAVELALAAALFYHASAAEHPEQWAGWRTSPSVPWRYVLGNGEQRHHVELQHHGADLEIQVGAQRVSLRLLDNDGRTATVEIDGVRRRCAFHLSADSLWINGCGGALQLLNLTHAPTLIGSQEHLRSGTLKAPMDGAIVEVLVNEGATVSKGQLLLVLEAMKMEHPLKAGIDGVIQRLQVIPGDQVKSRQVLLEVAPLGASG